tara:strand:- start:1270 stop:1626 length:357 start_codon:yes stop_codon:yes gene_type:complete
MPLFGIKQVDKTLNLIDKVIPDSDKKKELKAELIQAEINSDSAYLKNARPTVVYFGLFVIFLELLGVRLFITNKISLEAVKMSSDIMHYFLLTWGGVVGVYSVGRSFAEKKGAKLWKR